MFCIFRVNSHKVDCKSLLPTTARTWAQKGVIYKRSLHGYHLLYDLKQTVNFIFLLKRNNSGYLVLFTVPVNSEYKFEFN